MSVSAKTLFFPRWSVILSVVIAFSFCATSFAQIADIEKYIYLAKAIKRIAVKQLNFPDPAGFKTPNTELNFEVTAYDDKDQPVNLTPEQAKELLNVKAKNPLMKSVVDKKTVQLNSSKMPNTDRFQHIVKLFTDKGEGAARLEVRIADNYSKYSKAVGRQLISTGGTPGKESLIKTVSRNTKNWVVKHPYWTAGAGVVAVGATAAAAGGGGGGSNDGGGSGTGGSGENTAAFAGHISGGWSGTAGGMTVSGSFSLNIGSAGAVSGSYSGDQSGSLSGSVTGSGDMTAQGSGSGGVSWSGHISASGGAISGSGSWSSQDGSGSWSGGG